MLDTIIGIVIGLLIGWNLLPQPAWVRSLIDAAKKKISG
jgi:hypothetical protein